MHRMDRYRAPPKARPDEAGAAAADDEDSDELGVFAAERYFSGDDALALWPCERERSPSSLSSSAFRTGTTTHERDRSVSVPSSSEASWHSRSALLPNEPPADKLPAAAVAAAAAPIVQAKPPSGAQGQRASHRPASSSSSSSNMRRWLLGLGAAACACTGGASDESVSADDEERFSGSEIPEATTASVTLTPGSGGWFLLEGDDTLAGTDGHRRASATNLGELQSTPTSHPPQAAAAASTADSDKRRRVKSLELEMFRPVPPPVGDRGSALGSVPATRSAAFTVVAGNTALGVGGDAPRGGRGSPGEYDDDSAAPSELGCAAAYPPSEASVVWSVVTADGAASGNFSSAASGFYYRYCFDDDVDGGAMRRPAAGNTRRRRSGIASSSIVLLPCVRDKAVDAVGPARSVHRHQPDAVAALGASHRR